MKTHTIPSDLCSWLCERNSHYARSTDCPRRGGLVSVNSVLIDATEEITIFRRELAETLAFISYSNQTTCTVRKDCAKSSVLFDPFSLKKATTTQLPKAPQHFDLLMSFWMLPCIEKQATQHKISKMWPFGR